jgi:hypothetical protein
MKELIINIISLIVKVFGKFFLKKEIIIKKVSKTIKIKNSALPKIADFVNANCQRIYFKPDIIFTPSAETYHLAKSISSKFNDDILVLNGILIKKGKNERYISQILANGFSMFDTDNWQILIPNVLFENANNKILFVDDWAVVGGLIGNLKKYLRDDKKLDVETNFKSFCLATTKLAIQYNSAPDFYWKIISPNDELYLPWGKAEY